MEPVVRQGDLRPARWLVAVIALLTVGVGAPVSAGTSPEPSPPSTALAGPAVVGTANEFLPENANISECISSLPRPNCGSKARGGWRQTLVFVAIAAGLVLVGVRLYFAVRRRDRALNA